MMPPSLFTQNVIALIWDFDKTLIPGYMQEPLFKRFDIDGNEFWKEVNSLPDFHRDHGLNQISRDTLYLNHILTYVRHGKFPGLGNALLRELGAEIEFYEGLPEFFKVIKDSVANDSRFAKHEIEVEHYIVSTGLRQMIQGSKIQPHVDGIWACEFIEAVAPPGFLTTGAQETMDADVITDIGYVIDNTTKTRAIFEINKGCNKFPEIDVNSSMRPEDRRVPFVNMIYVADGPSDIPVFSVINQYDGKTFAVYKPGSKDEFVQVNSLQKQRRVQSFGEAIYKEGCQTYMWILNAVEEISQRIVEDRTRALGDRLGAPPHHIADNQERDDAHGSVGPNMTLPAR